MGSRSGGRPTSTGKSRTPTWSSCCKITPVMTWTASRVPPALSSTRADGWRNPPLRSCKTGTRRAWYAVLTLAALTGLAACTGGGSTVSSSTVGSSTAGSSTGSSSSGGAVGGPAVASTMSTEVIAGSGIATGPSVTVRASGDFTDKGTLKPPIDNPRTFVFRFDRGDLVVLNATGPTGGPANLNRTTCAFS